MSDTPDVKEIWGYKVKTVITNGVQRAYKAKLFEWVEANTANVEDFNLPISNVGDAEYALVQKMTGCTDKEMDEMDQATYIEILEYIKSLPHSPIDALSAE